jgi:adenylate cyclase
VSGRTRRLRGLLLLGAALLVGGIGILLQQTDALRRLELTSVDLRFHVRGDRPPPDDVVVVAVDAETFSADKDRRWPFSRAVHAKVIEQLTRARPAAIAYDVQFTESSGDSQAAVDADNALILAVRRARNVVLATTEVDGKGRTNIFGGAAGLAFSRGTPSNSNYVNDVDGRIRRVAFRIEGLTTFPLAAAGVARGRPVATIPGRRRAWIDYPGGPGRIRTLHFSDVEQGDFDAAAVRGKVVVVGATAPSLQDLHPTSTTGSGLMPGPEIQAAAAATALAGFPLRDAGGLWGPLTLLLLAAAAPLAAIRVRVVLALGLGVVLLAAFLVAAQVAFDRGTVLPAVYPALAGVAALAATALTHGVTVAFERERVRDAFARFVPEAVVDQVLRDADGVRLGGVRSEATVMFSDLRGFTSFAETLDPEQVIDALNRYLTEMSDAISAHGGTLVAYMGDGIMAVFGAPLRQDDHADRALAAAREMLDRLDGFNAWLAETGLHEGFKMGIGLNSGPVMSGNVGSERRLEYTALGDTTNTAARLEGMTKGTPHQLYVSDTTRQALTRSDAAQDLVAVGEAEVRGRKAKVVLWSLPGAAATPAPDPMPAVPAR